MPGAGRPSSRRYTGKPAATGAGNGMITISKGTLPLALFGPQGYGVRSGLLSTQARMLQAASPLLFGLLLDRVGIGAVGLSAGLCLAAFGSLFLLRPRRTVGAPFTGAQLNAVAYLLAFAALPGAPARSAWTDQLIVLLIGRRK